jgi:uncharacterized protein
MISLTTHLLQVGTEPREVSISVASSIMDIPATDWDACACDPANPENSTLFLHMHFSQV